MYVITGATGNIGKRIAETLLSKRGKSKGDRKIPGKVETSC